MYVVVIPIGHLKKPQRAAAKHKFDRIDMQSFVRQLRRCRVSDEIEVTPRAWTRLGYSEMTGVAFQIDIAGDEIQLYKQCQGFKVQILDGGTRDEPKAVSDVLMTRGMVPFGGLSYAV